MYKVNSFHARWLIHSYRARTAFIFGAAESNYDISVSGDILIDVICSSFMQLNFCILYANLYRYIDYVSRCIYISREIGRKCY